jgi:hypothetical protein
MRRQSAQDQTVTGEQATQAEQRLRACRTVSVVEFDEHFDQLVDLVERASVSREPWLAVLLWRHAARRAYETGNLDQLAKLFRSGVPHSRRVGQGLAAVFELCKLKRKKRGRQRKLFGISAEAQKAGVESVARRPYDTGNLDQLATLLRSGVPLSRQEGQMLADVFDLCKLKGKKRGGQRKLFEISAETQKARAECDVRLLQREKSISELSAAELRAKVWGLGLDVKMDDKVARAQDAQARRLGKLRNSKGRMSRVDAIQQVVQHHKLDELDVDKLTNWIDGRTGARQRHKTECQNFSEGGFSFWCITNEHRTERSSRKAAQRRVEDAELVGGGAGPSDDRRCRDAVAVPGKRSPN